MKDRYIDWFDSITETLNIISVGVRNDDRHVRSDFFRAGSLAIILVAQNNTKQNEPLALDDGASLTCCLAAFHSVCVYNKIWSDWVMKRDENSKEKRQEKAAAFRVLSLSVFVSCDAVEFYVFSTAVRSSLICSTVVLPSRFFIVESILLTLPSSFHVCL